MLAPGGRPPEFRLPCDRGQEISLADFQGRRIVLAFSPDTAYFDALAAHQDGLNKRDMVVLVILTPARLLRSHPISPPIFVLTDDSGRAADAYGVPAGAPFFCLIGKDGTIKQAGQDLPTPAELFETIDAMPMRRQEMQERDRQERG